MLREQIQEIRELLDKLVSNRNVKLSEGEILDVSERLDKLIAIYYEENSI